MAERKRSETPLTAKNEALLFARSQKEPSSLKNTVRSVWRPVFTPGCRNGVLKAGAKPAVAFWDVCGNVAAVWVRFPRVHPRSVHKVYPPGKLKRYEMWALAAPCVVDATSRPRFAVPAPHFALGEWHWVTYHMDGSVDARRGDHRLRYPEQLRLCGSVYVDRARSGRPGRWSITTSRWALAVDKFKVVVCWGQ